MSWFAREVKGEDLRSSAYKCAWVQTPQPAFAFIIVNTMFFHNSERSSTVFSIIYFLESKFSIQYLFNLVWWRG